MISCIIPTVGRAELCRAVESVLLQETEQPFEVWVVNDSTEPLAPAAWQHDPRVCITTTPHVERSVARNTGAALARYPFVLFLDDDDYLLPGAFAAFINAVTRSNRSDDSPIWWLGAYVVRKTTGVEQWIYPRLRGQVTTDIIGGARFPLGACLVRKDAFWACGGFDARIACNEDWDLCLRLSLLGVGEYIETGVASFLVGAPTSTTAWDKFQQTLDYVCEKNLNNPAFASAVRRCGDPYLRGCAFRAYMRLAARLGRQQKVRRALVCLTDGLWASGAWRGTKPFWRGAFRKQASHAAPAPTGASRPDTKSVAHSTARVPGMLPWLFVASEIVQ